MAENKAKVAVLVSGGGTNLQALIDAEKSGIIENGKIVRKEHIDLPRRLTNIIYCKNPRCITTTEQEIEHIFVLSDKGEYRCLYCETESN